MLIVIEGTDGSGKATQSKILKRRLEKQGYDVELISFPLYQTLFGQLIKKHLHGELTLPREAVCLLYALDRYQIKEKMEGMLKAGKIIICDRYSQSNIAYQAAQVKKEKREELIQWIKEVESRLPNPDVIIFLDMPPEKAKQLLSKQKDLDEYERKLEFQRTVREIYLKLAKKENWIIIPCVDGGRIKSIEEIADEIWAQIYHHLKPP